MALAIKITSKSEFGSVVRGFTTNTRNTTLPGHVGVTFYSTPAMTPTIVEQGLDEASVLELTGVYTDSTTGFVQTDVTAGKWNNATVEVFSYCWDNTSLGELLHFKGNIAEIKDYQTYFTCEGRGLIAKLSQEVEVVTSRLCRVKEFRDSECGHSASTVALTGFSPNVTQTNKTGGPVISIGGGVTFDISAFSGTVPTYGAQYTEWLLRWANGKITCTSGENSGVSREISAASEATGAYPYTTFWLKRPFPYDIALTTYTLVMGCNRTIEDCMTYVNITRRRAEDWVPGIEAINRLPQST